jgi:hypothetical protein
MSGLPKLPRFHERPVTDPPGPPLLRWARAKPIHGLGRVNGQRGRTVTFLFPAADALEAAIRQKISDAVANEQLILAEYEH